MRSSPKLASAALALSIVFLSLASNAFVEPKEEVATATLAWGLALGEDDPEKVLPFYADDAVLWGTLSPTVRSDRAALRDYFVTAFKVLPSLKVSFGDQINPGVWQHSGQYRLLYVLLCQGWRHKELARALQLHLRQERRALADR
jgi:hypothetical protein